MSAWKDWGNQGRSPGKQGSSPVSLFETGVRPCFPHLAFDGNQGRTLVFERQKPGSFPGFRLVSASLVSGRLTSFFASTEINDLRHLWEAICPKTCAKDLRAIYPPSLPRSAENAVSARTGADSAAKFPNPPKAQATRRIGDAGFFRNCAGPRPRAKNRRLSAGKKPFKGQKTGKNALWRTCDKDKPGLTKSTCHFCWGFSHFFMPFTLYMRAGTCCFRRIFSSGE